MIETSATAKVPSMPQRRCRAGRGLGGPAIRATPITERGSDAVTGWGGTPTAEVTAAGCSLP